MNAQQRQVRVAVVGTGFGRRVQIPGFLASKRVTLVAVCSRREKQAQETAQAFGIPRFYTDYEELLNEETLDLVSIATPPHLHESMAVRAFERDLNVLCEKPLALDLDGAYRMQRAARESTKVHAVDHELRFHPNRRYIKSLLDEGRLGRPLQAVVTYFSDFRADALAPWDWWSDKNRGGGALGAVGSHEIDMLQWWFGEIDSVYATLQTSVPERLSPDGRPLRVTSDDALALLLTHRSGVHSQVVISNIAWGPRREGAWIFCEDSSIELQGHDRLLLFEAHEKRGRDISQPDVLDLPDNFEDRAPPRAFIRLADHLAHVIANNVPQEGATFDDGVHTQQVISAAKLSIEEARRINITENAIKSMSASN